MKANKSKTQMLKEHGVSYLGSVKQSAKLMASYRLNELTFGIYLAPSDMSGYDVCPCSKHCRANCLNLSGNNKVFELSEKSVNPIMQARIKKTKWFFEDRDSFMRVLIDEINHWKAYAANHGHRFSVRLNCTSDLSPEDFVIGGVNILQIFPDVQFYDYTKVYSRLRLVKKYANYDLTFSFDGYNWNACECALDQDVRVAVVFAKELPKDFCGYPVINGTLYDMRYIDPKVCVVGLEYHPTANDYKDGHFVMPNSRFIVKADDERCNVVARREKENLAL